MIDTKLPLIRHIKSDSSPRGPSTYEVEVIETNTNRSLGWARTVGGAYIDSVGNRIDFGLLPTSFHQGRVEVHRFATNIESAYRRPDQAAA